jgi:hypothetical protein
MLANEQGTSCASVQTSIPDEPMTLPWRDQGL